MGGPKLDGEARLRGTATLTLDSAPSGPPFLRTESLVDGEGEVTAPVGSRSEDAAFRARDLVAGRYRIVRFIARGGMGDVFEARDEMLDAAVALKVLRPERAHHSAPIFQETQLARRVTHPNVCRLFDVGFHERDGGDRVPFLSMELLAGETLRAHLQAHGALPESDALNLARQIAAGLGRAHACGVVHRDLKGDNVLLVTEADGSMRAVITDFGIAVLMHVPKGAAVDVRPRGTPAYMAPEQRTGGPITAQTDVYAFGVLLFEMVTGVLPFANDAALTPVMQDRTLYVPSARARLPDLARTWDRVIARCLEQDPHARYASPEAAFADLTSTSRVTSRARFWRAVLAIGTLGLFALAFAAKRRADDAYKQAMAARSSPGLSAMSSDVVAPVRDLVAVFTPQSTIANEQAQWLGIGLAEVLAVHVASTGTLRALTSETVGPFVPLGHDDASSDARDKPALAKRVGANLGARYVVLGTYTAGAVGAEGIQPLRVTLDLRDGRTGDLLGAVDESLHDGEWFDLVARLSRGIRVFAGAESPDAGLTLQPRFPKGPRAARLYVEGLARARRFEFMDAKELLSQSAVLEPGVAEVHVALAQVYATLGDDPRAAREAKRAWEASAGSPSAIRAAAEATYREASKEWPAALLLRKASYQKSPADVEAGLALARTQRGEGDARAAIVTLDAVRLVGAAASDPRVDLEEGWAANVLGDHRRKEAAARRAVEKARARGAVHLEAEARDQLGWALVHQGRFDDAMSEFLMAQQLFQRVGYRGGVGKSLHSQGNLLLLRGAIEEGVAREEKALEAIRASGNHLWEAWSTNCYGNGLADLGFLKRAALAYERSCELAEDVGAPMDQAIALVSLGEVRIREGEREDAHRYFQRALVSSEHLHSAYVTGVASRALAMSLADLGDGDGAERALVASEAALREEGLAGELPLTLYEFGSFLVRQKQWPESRRKLEDAATLFTALGSPGLAATYAKLAEGAMMGSETRAAEDYVRQALAVLARDARGVAKAPALARTHAIRARLWLAQGHTKEAKEEASQAISAAQRMPEDRRLLLETRIATARARGGNVDAALDADEASARAMGSALLLVAARAERAR